MSRFFDALRSGRVLLMDGAMGTELQRAGIQAGECYELSNLTHPDRVRAIHQAYVHAGAECLLTNTFQANPQALARHQLEEQLEKINQAAVAISRSVCQPTGFVLGDIGPVAKDPLSAAHRLMESLQGADALLLETFSDLGLLATLLKVRSVGARGEPLPILFSFTFQRTSEGDLRTKTGYLPAAVARLARRYPIAALGVNCGRDIGMDEIIEIVRQYRSATDLPLFARPNAGSPIRAGEQWIYPHTPEAMAARLPELLEAGVCMVGGCCGTTPAHIAAFRPIIDAWNARS
jgi:5-methyltetrahydrofolate--homocysteine methyltransferase